jgi:hypothetical protein
VRVHFENVIGYTPREAARAFSPHASEAAIRRGIKAGVLKFVSVGNRKYLLRDALIQAIERGQIK